jgi:protein TonB
VVLQIAIGEDGSVIEALVLRSIPMLDQAAIDAVIQWVYQPTLLNGMPVEVEMTVTINFTLR